MMLNFNTQYKIPYLIKGCRSCNMEERIHYSNDDSMMITCTNCSYTMIFRDNYLFYLQYTISDDVYINFQNDKPTILYSEYKPIKVFPSIIKFPISIHNFVQTMKANTDKLRILI